MCTINKGFFFYFIGIKKRVLLFLKYMFFWVLIKNLKSIFGGRHRKTDFYRIFSIIKKYK